MDAHDNFLGVPSSFLRVEDAISCVRENPEFNNLHWKQSFFFLQVLQYVVLDIMSGQVDFSSKLISCPLPANSVSIRAG